MKQAIRISFLVTLVATALTEVAHAQSSGIEIFAGETLFDRGLRLSATPLYERKGSIHEGSSRKHNDTDRLYEEHRAVIGVDYGLLPDLTLSALIPYVAIEQRTRIPGNTVRQRADGLGDIAALAKYRVYKHDWDQSTFNVSVLGGLEFPTGETDSRDGGMRLPPTLQVGSGSWDPIVAVAATLSLGRFRYDAHALYKINTEGSQKYREGDFFFVEVDAKYRFWHTAYPGPTGSAKIGVQWRHEQRDELGGNRLDNTGSNELALRPGLGFHPIPQMDISLSVDIPVYQHARGRQLVRDLRTFIAVGMRF